MKIFIQNMISLRCKMTVQKQLEALNIGYQYIDLGVVLLEKPLIKSDRILLKTALHKSGLELMDNKNALLIEKLVTIIEESVQYSDDVLHVNLSSLIAEKMNQDYHRMAEIFSKTKGITIEQFMILHKIEKIKELIIYDKLSLTEISYRMNYSSVSHLSRQFKQITGLTPTFFKSLSKKQQDDFENK
ncbi:MAG: AraC family transcriptional regulator [Flavobacteriaceae bacterium CG2_30_31_66]|nr:MAG: AraC family transcriptional regulator [Flavobacteriaceae bacterium CG2_30_31_66]